MQRRLDSDLIENLKNVTINKTRQNKLVLTFPAPLRPHPFNIGRGEEAGIAVVPGEHRSPWVVYHVPRSRLNAVKRELLEGHSGGLEGGRGTGLGRGRRPKQWAMEETMWGGGWWPWSHRFIRHGEGVRRW